MVIARLAATALCLLCWAMPVAAQSSCASRLMSSDVPNAADQTSARNLIELRDFGSVDTGGSADPSFSLSPDGKWLALILRRADVVNNTYCAGVLLVPTTPGTPPRLIDTGGEFISKSNDVRGVPGIVNGSPNFGTPSWSADGRWIVYRRRDRGITQVWRTNVRGAASPLTNLATDADYVWAEDGRSIVVSSRPPLLVPRDDKRARAGYLYDEHFWTLSEAIPRVGLPLPINIFSVDVERETANDAIAIGPRLPRSDRAPVGWRASVELTDPLQPFGDRRLRVDGPAGRLRCGVEICGRGVSAAWWFGNSLIFRRDGLPSNGGTLRFYRWDVTSSRLPKLLLQTTDAIFGCTPAAKTLLCAKEAATEPRTIVRLDPQNGHIDTVFNPNTGFAQLKSGIVERLTWSDHRGIRSYGDLMLPPNHRRGQRHPLVIVQYQSRGFLRGGTGDEYPIRLLASRGLAVLSFQKPELLPAARRAKDLDALQRINVKDWAERRMILRSIDAGIDAAIATGSVDETRIGITGLSDGSAQAQFAMLNSGRISAAAISSCCEDPSELFVAGTAYAAALVHWGYPATVKDGENFWKALSLAENAGSSRIPLLLQSSDNEYRLALETYGALRRAGTPTEMYVFPDEYHVKVQPAHRAAVYRRSVAWFDFWLLGNYTPEDATADERARWRAMRASGSGSITPTVLPTADPGLGIKQPEKAGAALAVH